MLLFFDIPFIFSRSSVGLIKFVNYDRLCFPSIVTIKLYMHALKEV